MLGIESIRLLEQDDDLQLVDCVGLKKTCLGYSNRGVYEWSYKERGDMGMQSGVGGIFWLSWRVCGSAC